MAALTALLAGLATAAPTVRADQWINPTETGALSPDGRVVVRVIPGESWGEVEGFKGAPTGKHAIARFYRLDEAGAAFVQYREQELLNPVAPVFLTVTDDGALVTLDNWHNAGYGPVLVVYAPSGEVLKSYALKDLYSEEQIRQFPISVSSIWWRCSSQPPASRAAPRSPSPTRCRSGWRSIWPRAPSPSSRQRRARRGEGDRHREGAFVVDPTRFSLPEHTP